jgi:CheY-like chemotaxis protein
MDNDLNPILLVEDRATDLDLTKRAFARHRLLNPVQVARNGEEALEYIRRWEAGEPTPVCILISRRPTS